MKNKSLKGKLILSVATLGLAAASTIGSTFAWFTINTEAKVSSVDMSVSSATGVYARKKGGVWTDNIEVKTGATTDDNWVAVTPKNTNDKWGGTFKSLDLGSTIENSTYTYSDVTTSTTEDALYVTNGDHKNFVAYQFTLEFMVTTGYDVTIEASSVKVVGKDGNAVTASTKADAVVRIAFTDLATTSKDGETAAFATADYANSTIYTLRDSESDTTDFAFENLKAIAKNSKGFFGNGKDGTSDGNSDYTRASKVLKNDLNKGTTQSPIGEQKVIDVHSNAKTTDGSLQYGSTIVTVWFDGTDKECTNGIFNQKLSFALSLNAKAHE